MSRIDGVYCQDETRLSRHVAETDTWETIEGYELMLAPESNILREALAAYAHDGAWSGWMKYQFSKGDLNPDGSWTMPAWAVERWMRQMNTPYNQLSESERASDRAEADKMLAIIHADAEQLINGNGHTLGGEEIEELGNDV